MDSETVDEAWSYLIQILLSISLVGAFCTLLTFGIFQKLKIYPMKLIMYLCVCIFMSFFFFLIADADRVVQSDFCKGAAVFIHFFNIGNFGWTLCVAFNFYQMIVRRNREGERLEKLYHLFVWFLASICVIGTGASGSYGVTGDGLCFITSEVAHFVAFVVPGLLIMSINVVLFFWIACEIHETFVLDYPRSWRLPPSLDFGGELRVLGHLLLLLLLLLFLLFLLLLLFLPLVLSK